ncbi:MAG: hypothetical protein JKY65_03665, partial [Planctomycetes bacterium]|nr:hypothetical protein [Planctomycetota bacterium]
KPTPTPAATPKPTPTPAATPTPAVTPIASTADLAKRKKAIRRERRTLKGKLKVWRKIANHWALELKVLDSSTKALNQDTGDEASLERLRKANKELPEKTSQALVALLLRRLKALSEAELPGASRWAADLFVTIKAPPMANLAPHERVRVAEKSLKEAREKELDALQTQVQVAVRMARSRVPRKDLEPLAAKLKDAKKLKGAGQDQSAIEGFRALRAEAMKLYPSAPHGLKGQTFKLVTNLFVGSGYVNLTALAAVSGAGGSQRGDRFVAIGYQSDARVRGLLVIDSRAEGLMPIHETRLGRDAFTVAVGEVSSEGAFTCFVGEQDAKGDEPVQIRKLTVDARGKTLDGLEGSPFLVVKAESGRLHDLTVMADGTLAVLLSNEILLFRGGEQVRQVLLSGAHAMRGVDSNPKVVQAVGGAQLRLPRRMVSLGDGSLVVTGLKDPHPQGSKGPVSWRSEAREAGRGLRPRLGTNWRFNLTVVPPHGKGEIRTHDPRLDSPSPGAIVALGSGLFGIEHRPPRIRLTSGLRKKGLGDPKAVVYRGLGTGNSRVEMQNAPRFNPSLVLDAIVTGDTYVMIGASSSHLGGDLDQYVASFDPEGRTIIYTFRVVKKPR